MFTPSGIDVPGAAKRARETAFFAYATAPSLAGFISVRCAPTTRTSGASNAARTTAYAARGARPPTWMPPIVTPCGSTLGVGLGFGFGFGAVVVVDVVAVVVAVVVVESARRRRVRRRPGRGRRRLLSGAGWNQRCEQACGGQCERADGDDERALHRP